MLRKLDKKFKSSITEKHEYNIFLSFEGTFKNKEQICEHKYTKKKLLPKVIQRYAYLKLLKLYQLCHILKIPLVIYHF